MRRSPLVVCAALIAALSMTAAPALAVDVSPGTEARPLADENTRADAYYSTEFTVKKLPVGGALRAGIEMRKSGNSSVLARAYINPQGTLSVQVLGTNGRTVKTVKTGYNLTAGKRFHIESEILGGTRGSVKVRAWPAGKPRVPWQLEVDDMPLGASRGEASTYMYLSKTAKSELNVTNTLMWERSAPSVEGWFPNGTRIANGAMAPGDTATIFTTGGECRIDRGSWGPCGTDGTQFVLKDLAGGKHTVDVRSPRGTVKSLSFNVATPRSDKWGTFRPGLDTVGVPDGARLTVMDGSEDGRDDGVLKIDTAAHPELANLDHKEIRGLVEVVRGNVTITNSRITAPGPGPDTDRGVLYLPQHKADQAKLTVRDTTVRWGNGLSYDDPRAANVIGIKGANITAERVHVYNVSDGVNIDGSNFALRGSVIDQQFYSSDPSKSDGVSHNDGIQISAGRNIDVRGNDIRGYSSAALMIIPQARLRTLGIFDLRIRDNWLDGGSCTINAHHKNRPLNNISITNNKFGMNQRPTRDDRGNLRPSACAGKQGRHGILTGATNVTVKSNREITNGGSVRGTAYIRDATANKDLG